MERNVRGILFIGLAVIAALVTGSMYVVFDRASRSYHDAVDRCHDAGGAWVASGARSYSGQCLRAPGTSSARP